MQITVRITQFKQSISVCANEAHVCQRYQCMCMCENSTYIYMLFDTSDTNCILKPFIRYSNQMIFSEFFPDRIKKKDALGEKKTKTKTYCNSLLRHSVCFVFSLSLTICNLFVFSNLFIQIQSF